MGTAHKLVVIDGAYAAWANAFIPAWHGPAAVACQFNKQLALCGDALERMLSANKSVKVREPVFRCCAKQACRRSRLLCRPQGHEMQPITTCEQLHREPNSLPAQMQQVLRYSGAACNYIDAWQRVRLPWPVVLQRPCHY